ncbi:MAG: type II secretion system F family protein [Pseudomonadota bacterium]
MSRHRPLPLPVRALLFQHLAAMEKAGLPAERAFALLELGLGARDRVDTFRRLFARGVDPATAGSNSGLFTTFETRLLRAAFSAGSPEPTYRRLAVHHAAHARQASTLRARLVLPVAVLAIALFVQPLPQLFSGTISMADYMLRTVVPLGVIACIGMVATNLNAWFGSGEAAPGRQAVERALLAMPLFGKLHLRRNARDFTESLALLLQAGLSLFEALPVALDTVDNHLVRQDLATLLPAVHEGATLSQAIAKLRLVDTKQLFAFVHTGEESGSLAEMLMRHADAESESLALAQGEIMTWLPRVLYALVALWMVVQLLGRPHPGLSAIQAAYLPQWQA